MAKVKITEDTLRNMVKERVKKDLNEEPALALNYYEVPQNETNLIVEMARLNKKETGNCIFPYDSWEVKIWSTDYNPPHFHIIKEGWDVSFTIDNGELLAIKSMGENRKVYNYMCKNVNKWLSSTCVAQKKITNKENALLHWESLHED